MKITRCHVLVFLLIGSLGVWLLLLGLQRLYGEPENYSLIEPELYMRQRGPTTTGHARRAQPVRAPGPLLLRNPPLGRDPRRQAEAEEFSPGIAEDDGPIL